MTQRLTHVKGKLFENSEVRTPKAIICKVSVPKAMPVSVCAFPINAAIVSHAQSYTRDTLHAYILYVYLPDYVVLTLDSRRHI